MVQEKKERKLIKRDKTRNPNDEQSPKGVESLKDSVSEANSILDKGKGSQNLPSIKKNKSTTTRKGRTAKGRRTKYYKPYKPREAKKNKSTEDKKKKRRKPNHYLLFSARFRKFIESSGYDYSVTGLSYQAFSGKVWKSMSEAQRKLERKGNLEHRDIFYETVCDSYLVSYSDVKKEGLRVKDLEGINIIGLGGKWFELRDDLLSLFNSTYFKSDFGDTVEINGGGITDDVDLTFENYDRVLDRIHSDFKLLFFDRANPSDRNAYVYYDVESMEIRPDNSILIRLKTTFESEADAEYYRSINRGDYSLKKDDSGESRIVPTERKKAESSKGDISLEVQREIERGKTERAQIAVKSIETMFSTGKISFEQYLAGLKAING